MGRQAPPLSGLYAGKYLHGKTGHERPDVVVPAAGRHPGGVGCVQLPASGRHYQMLPTRLRGVDSDSTY